MKLLLGMCDCDCYNVKLFSTYFSHQQWRNVNGLLRILLCDLGSGHRPWADGDQHRASRGHGFQRITFYGSANHCLQSSHITTRLGWLHQALYGAGEQCHTAEIG